MKKYEEFDLYINTYGYDKNSCGVKVDIENFNYEILEEISKNENLEKIETVNTGRVFKFNFKRR